MLERSPVNELFSSIWEYFFQDGILIIRMKSESDLISAPWLACNKRMIALGVKLSQPMTTEQNISNFVFSLSSLFEINHKFNNTNESLLVDCFNGL